MTGRSGARLAVGLLAAVAAGCGSSRPFQSGVIARAADKNPPAINDNRYGPAVGPAAASSWPATRPPANPAATWPPADVIRVAYGEELAAGQPTGQPVVQPPPSPPTAGLQPAHYNGGGYDRPPAVPDPNVRHRPTAVGRDWALAPHESPIDRAIELQRRIEQLSKENLAQLARIRQLESAGEARETALNETLRDVQNASDEVTRARSELQTLRKELIALKARVLQVEKDEAETLKAVIAAIEKLLQQAPDNGKK